MTDGDALLAAIRANPEDDTPRLVYADWLDENGEPERAEFIRVQCAISNHPRDSDSCLCGYAPRDGYHHNSPLCPYVRSEELLAKHETAWRRAGPCPECGGDGRRFNPGKANDPCRHCWRGDRGGLLRPFGYPNGTHEMDTVSQARIEWRCGFPEVVTVPRLSDCAHLVSVQHPTERFEPTPWLVALVNHHPVEQVVPLDREPEEHAPGSGQSEWCWYDVGTGGGAEWYWVPAPLLAIMRDEASDEYLLGSRVSFPTRAAAVAALGRAIVTWARGVPSAGHE